MAIIPFVGYCGLIKSVVSYSVSEVTGPNYARQAIQIDLVSNQSNQLQSQSSVEWTAGSGGDWGYVAYFGFWDAATLGNLIFYTPQQFVQNEFAFYISANETVLLPAGFFSWDFYDPIQRPWYPFGTTMGISTNVTGGMPILSGSPIVNINGMFVEANTYAPIVGTAFFDTYNVWPVWLNGTVFVNAVGQQVEPDFDNLITSPFVGIGPTSGRPSNPVPGGQYFDTSIASPNGAPVWWTGTEWVNATGSAQ